VGTSLSSPAAHNQDKRKKKKKEKEKMFNSQFSKEERSFSNQIGKEKKKKKPLILGGKDSRSTNPPHTNLLQTVAGTFF